jgi:hypothetical protein
MRNAIIVIGGLVLLLAAARLGGPELMRYLKLRSM